MTLLKAMRDATDVVISIGNHQITGRGVYCSALNLDAFPDQFEINITLVGTSENLVIESQNGDYKPKIRNKKVGDCSISELLFAVREKIKM